MTDAWDKVNQRTYWDPTGGDRFMAFFFSSHGFPSVKTISNKNKGPRSFGRFKVWIVVKETFHFTSWWLNQPISKICSSNWIISPPKKKAFGNPTWTCPWNLSFGNPTKKLPLKKPFSISILCHLVEIEVDPCLELTKTLQCSSLSTAKQIKHAWNQYIYLHLHITMKQIKVYISHRVGSGSPWLLSNNNEVISYPPWNEHRPWK